MRKFGVFDAVLALLVVAGIAANVFVYGFFGKGDPTDQPEASGKPAVAAETPGVSSSPAPSGNSPAQSSTQAATTAEQPQGGSAAVPEAPETERPREEPATAPEAPAASPESQNSFADYRGYADGETPSIGDFFWFTEDVKWDGLPAGRTALTDFGAVSGYWKAYTEELRTVLGEPVLHDLDSAEWFNAEIGGGAGSATFTYHTRGFSGVEYQGQASVEYDLSFRDGDSQNGRFADGRLVVGDVDARGVELRLAEFYALDGKQFAVGEIEYVSGEYLLIALVRP